MIYNEIVMYITTTANVTKQFELLQYCCFMCVSACALLLFQCVSWQCGTTIGSGLGLPCRPQAEFNRLPGIHRVTCQPS